MIDLLALGDLADEAGLAEPSIVLRSLDNERALDLELAGRRPLYPASMIKVPLAAALMTLIARGERSATDRVAVAQTNMTANDCPSPLMPGYEATLEELLDLVITRSDNVATNVLIDVVGRARATSIAHELGLHGTAIHRKLSGSEPLIEDPEATGRNTHPAHDAALLFEHIARGTVAGAHHLRELLLHQQWNTKLSRGLLAHDKFAHKTGDTEKVSHDGGILKTVDGESYIVVVYSALPGENEASDARFAHFMQMLRPLL